MRFGWLRVVNVTAGNARQDFQCIIVVVVTTSTTITITTTTTNEASLHSARQEPW
jgi:hypothetical protein